MLHSNKLIFIIKQNYLSEYCGRNLPYFLINYMYFLFFFFVYNGNDE